MAQHVHAAEAYRGALVLASRSFRACLQEVFEAFEGVFLAGSVAG